MGFLKENALPQIRDRISTAMDRLRVNGWSVVQAALAASIAYSLAIFVLGHDRPFFAPIAAVVSLSVTFGERGRRAVEIAFGVAVGLLVADLLVLFIGVGIAQIGAVVLLAMAAAVLVGGGALLVNQAAISALLVVVLEPPDGGFAFDRFFDALVGGGVALAVNYLIPINPERLVERTARPIFDELADVLEEIAAALKDADLSRAEHTLEKAREIDERVRNFSENLAAGRDTARFSPTRRRALKHLELYAAATTRIDLTVINGRILARGAANAVRRGDPVPQLIPEAVLDLARATRALAEYLEETEGPEEIRQYALKAAEGATRSLRESQTWRSAC